MSGVKKIRPLQWWTETDIRPAPVFCVFASVCFFALGRYASSVGTWWYALSITMALFSIQITIWRAALMIVRGGVVIDEAAEKNPNVQRELSEI